MSSQNTSNAAKSGRAHVVCSRLCSLLMFVTMAMLAACGGDTPEGPPAVASITIAVSTSFIIPGSTQLLIATVKAADGTTLSGRAVAWSSSNSSVAKVSLEGVLDAVAPGTTTITATSESKSATTAITVAPAPVATVTTALASSAIPAGSTTTATATVRDVSGKVVIDRPISWTSSNLQVATVTAEGVVTAVGIGETTIAATCDSKIGSATLTVTAASAPLISSVSPATLVPGATATITGVRFDTAVSRNVVSIRGVNAPVIASSTTQLTVTVPCVNSGSAAIIVSAAGQATPSFVHPVAVTTRTLGVGQSLVVTNNAGSLCNEFVTTAPSARYVIAVFSAATSPNTLANFEIAGNTPASGVVEPVVAPAPLVVSVDSPENAAQDDAHWRMLERDRRQYEQSRARAALLARTASNRRTASPSASASAGQALNAALLPEVGELRDFFFTFNGGCSDVSKPMHTKAIYVGTRAIVWEDTANTLQSSNDPAYAGFFQRLGQIFDQDQYATVRDNFGDPLLRDALTDTDGHIHMVFSSRLLGSGAAAYVTSCDQFPRTINAGSNFGEVFYGQVPTTTGTNINSTNYPDGWFYFMTRTVVHEVKHIASLAARIANNAPTFEQSWLEEGTARHAEEMWVRNYLHHVGWKTNTGFGTAATNGIYCDFHPTDPTCNAADPLRRPSYGMRRQFNEIRDKLTSPWDWSPYGDGTSQTGSVFYQTAWSLVRYAIDRYGSSDAAFFKALVNSSTNGVANLTNVAGTSLDQLIGGWGLALFADDYPGLTPLNPDLQFQTWNLRNIYAGLNASPSWNTRFPTAFPIAPVQLTFGTFVSPRAGLRGGAHSYYELSGPASANQLIQLRGTDGAAPSANLRIAIARLQ